MGEDKTVLGSIHISPAAVATIAYHATMESYGVVGLAPKNMAEGLAQAITRDLPGPKACRPVAVIPDTGSQ